VCIHVVKRLCVKSFRCSTLAALAAQLWLLSLLLSLLWIGAATLCWIALSTAVYPSPCSSFMRVAARIPFQLVPYSVSIWRCVTTLFGRREAKRERREDNEYSLKARWYSRRLYSDLIDEIEKRKQGEKGKALYTRPSVSWTRFPQNP
jgi:hypothetical protein